jgi:hypothetical protein
MYLFLDLNTVQLPKDAADYNNPKHQDNRLIEIACSIHDEDWEESDNRLYYIMPDTFEVIPKTYFNKLPTNLTIEEEGLSIRVVLKILLTILEKYDYWIGYDIYKSLSVIEYELTICGYNKDEWRDFCKSKNKFCLKNDPDVIRFYNRKIDPLSINKPTLENLYHEIFNEKIKQISNTRAKVRITAKCFWELVENDCYNSEKTELKSIRNFEIIPEGLPELIPFRDNDKWGFVNSNKNIQIPIEYEYVSPFEYGYSIIRDFNYKYFAISAKGKIVNTRENNAHHIVNEKFLITEKDGKFGVYNFNGNEILKAIFSNIDLRFDNLFFVKKERHQCYQILNYPEETHVQTKYIEIDSASDGLLKVKDLDYLTGFINSQGEIVIPLKYNNATNFKNNLSIVYNHNRGYGIINKNGQELTTLSYQNIYQFEDVSTIISKDNKYGIISKEGKILVDCSHQSISNYSDGLALANNNYIFSYIDTLGNTIFQLKGIHEAFPFSNKIARVKGKGGFGFFDKTGKQIVNYKYTEAEDFTEKLAAVKVTKKWGLIDKSGNELTEFKYDEIISLNQGYFCTKISNRWGLMDSNGREICPCKYDKHFSFYTKPPSSYALAVVTLNGKDGLIDYMGNEIVGCKYNRLVHCELALRRHSGLFSVIGPGSATIGYIDKSGEEYFV